MTAVIKYPHLDQLRSAIHNVKHRATYRGRDADGQPMFDPLAKIPTIKYRGTTKLHGCNSSIVYDVLTSELTYQSRERILSLTQDNHGFMLAQLKNEDWWLATFDHLADICETSMDPDERLLKKIVIYGEWAGGSIQSGVAISKLEKAMYIFGIKLLYHDAETIDEDGEIDDVVWVDMADYKWVKNEELRIFNIMDYKTWEIDIDFARPDIAQAQMVKWVEEVEAECPVGKAFGVSGTGEGIVWNPIEDGWRTSKLMFKTKGSAHSVSKVRTLAAVDVEAMNTLHEFVDTSVTENRLEQGLQNLVNEQLKPFDMTSMGDFIRWVFNDVVREEQDVIVASGLDPKKLGGPIANKARPWYINKLNSMELV